MKRITSKRVKLVSLAASAIVAVSVATAMAAPVLQPGTTVPAHADRGACANCHTYAVVTPPVVTPPVVTPPVVTPPVVTPPVVTPPVVTPPVVTPPTVGADHDNDGDHEHADKKVKHEKHHAKKHSKHAKKHHANNSRAHELKNHTNNSRAGERH